MFARNPRFTRQKEILSAARYRLNPTAHQRIRKVLISENYHGPLVTHGARHFRPWAWVGFWLVMLAIPAFLVHASMSSKLSGRPPVSLRPHHRKAQLLKEYDVARSALDRLHLPHVPLYLPRFVPIWPVSIQARALPNGGGYVLTLGTVSLIATQHTAATAASASVVKFQGALQHGLVPRPGGAPIILRRGVTASWYSEGGHLPSTSADVNLIWQTGSVWFDVRALPQQTLAVVQDARMLAQLVQQQPLTHTGLAVVSVTVWPVPNHSGADLGLEMAWARAKTTLTLTAIGTTTHVKQTNPSIPELWKLATTVEAMQKTP